MVEADAKQCFTPVASVKDKGVACGLARHVVGCFEVVFRRDPKRTVNISKT
jgi:hypothetical protein